MAAKLKKGDKITVLSGKDKGKEGEITSVNPSTGKAIVSGVNVAVRHTKQSQTSQGGRVSVEMPNAAGWESKASQVVLLKCQRHLSKQPEPKVWRIAHIKHT